MNVIMLLLIIGPALLIAGMALCIKREPATTQYGVEFTRDGHQYYRDPWGSEYRIDCESMRKEGR